MPMNTDDSYRLKVLKALTAHLEGINPDNGYAYNMVGSVKRGRTLFGTDDPMPMISVLESPRSDAGRFAGEYERQEEWSLMIQGWVDDDFENPTDPAYGLLDAVEHRLHRLVAINGKTGNPVFPDEYMLGRLIAGLTVPPGVVRPPMEGVSSKAFFYLQIRLTLVKPD